MQTPTGPGKAFIAELVSWPGNSGSPVFLNLTGLRDGNLSLGTNFKFLGLLSGSFLNRIPATVPDSSQLLLGDGANIGVSFIVPAEKVRAVLESTAARRWRDSAVQSLADQPR